MKGLSEKFASLQQEGYSNVETALRLLQEIVFPTKEESRTNNKAVELRVFVAGLPRTGTGSLAVALTELGYTPLHGPGIMELEAILEDHYAGRANHLDVLRWQEEHGFDVQGMDQLGWKLYKEAVEHYTDAKIILTEHPVDSLAWAESWSSFAPDHIYYFGRAPFSYLSSLRIVMTLQRDFLTYIGGGGVDDPRDPRFAFPALQLARAYTQHNEDVKKFVPKERLLVFNPRQGWDPLCGFLEIDKHDCPTTPYPHLTDRELMMAMSKVAMVITCVWPMLPVIVLALMVYFVYNRKRHVVNRKRQRKQMAAEHHVKNIKAA